MNPAVVRLLLLGSRPAWGRLAGVTAGVAVGTALLLLLVGAYGALQDRDERTAWLRLEAWNYLISNDADTPLSDDAVLWRASQDHYRGQSITRRDVAATPGTTVRIPGIGAPPRPGEYYASPALAELIGSVPADELGDRYGTLVGTLPDRVLAGPDSLVVVVGQEERKLTEEWWVGTAVVSDFTGQSLGENVSYRTVMVIGGVAVFLPIVLLVSIVTQLGAAERRERFAALRLIGASQRTVVGVAAGEAAATGLFGALLGVGLFHLLRPVAATVPVGESAFFPADLAVSPGQTALAGISLVAAATAAAAWRVHRVGIGPLGGGVRQRPERTPTAWRTVPLLAGLAVLGMASRGLVPPGWVFTAHVGGFVLVTVGILVVGPWLTRLLAAALRRLAHGASGVIAAGRLRTAPVSAFRAVSGLVVAVFLVSVFAGGASGVQQRFEPRPVPGLLPVADLFASVDPEHFNPGLPAAAAEVAGVEHVSVGYASPVQDEADEGWVVVSAEDAAALGFPEVPDSAYVTFNQYEFRLPEGDTAAELRAAAVTATDGLAPSVVYVGTDGDPATLERARTTLTLAGLLPGDVLSRGDHADLSSRRLASSLAVLAYLGMAIALGLAGISLAVATAAAVLDRKRVFGLLRLTGMPQAVLRRVVALEAAVPLLAVLAPSAGLGFLTVWLVLSGLPTDISVAWPDSRYFGSLGVGLLLAFGAVAATFGVIRRSTAVTTTRYE